ncbi:MAG: hypothetical protein D6744_08820, partial [Planctomycetota bacterium]
ALIAAIDETNINDVACGPVLWLHGADDGQVNARQARNFETSAFNYGSAGRVIVYDGERHGWRDVDQERASAGLAFLSQVMLGIRDVDDDLYEDSRETTGPPTASTTSTRDHDSDSDGQPDGHEVLIGTNPLDPTSVFRITGVTLVPQLNGTTAEYSLTITYQAPPGAYKLQRCPSFDEGNPVWYDVTTGPNPVHTLSAPGVLNTDTFTVTVPTSEALELYRVTVVVDLNDPTNRFYGLTPGVTASGAVFNGISTVSTEPVGRLTKRVGRANAPPASQQDERTNFLAAAFQRRDEFVGRGLQSAAGFDFNGAFAGATPLAGMNLQPDPAGDTHYAVVTRDLTRTTHASYPAEVPLQLTPAGAVTPNDDRRLEGHWWEVMSQTSTEVALRSRPGAATSWAPNPSANAHEVAIRRIATLDDVLGPTEVTDAIRQTGIVGIEPGDLATIYTRQGSVLATYVYTLDNTANPPQWGWADSSTGNFV